MPKGNPNWKKKDDTQTLVEKGLENQSDSPALNVDELIAKAVADALEKQRLEIHMEKPPIKKIKHNFIPDHARVRISTNIDGKFIISDTRGQNFFIELNGYKDSTTISFKDLKNFYGKNYTLFTSGKLVVADVSSDSEIELVDVIRDLNLNKIYLDNKKVSPIDIENLFTDNIQASEFESKLKNSTEIVETIVEVGHILYKQGQFSDNNKMNIIRQMFRNPSLFTR